jgi:dTDP-glucose 4,6-dehydratase|tara:strand:- start:541 stop:1428 length:888 start_codon:yes stop_codon:yes gene_type:complete
MRIIVTGACGFIGSHFVNLIGNQYPTIEILVVDKLTYASNVNNLKVPVKFIKKDICDITHEDLGVYDYIVNFAAESHVDNSIKDGKPFVRTNVEGTFNLLEVARKNPNLKKFIQISTDEVYGDMDEHGEFALADESFNLIGSSYYSATKASSDLLVQAAGRTYGLPYLITRTCNNYGENQHQEKLLPTIINCIKNNFPIPIYGDGKNIREWIHADDNSQFIWDLIQSDKTGVYNIGSGERYTNLQIIEIIEKILGYQLDLKFVQDRKGHDRAYGLRTTLKPKHNLKEYLKNILTY